jgi:hypothetical protein
VIKTGTLEAGIPMRRFANLASLGDGNHGETSRTEIITPDLAQGTGPQAFLVEQGPLSLNAPHFHTQDQFQVVVAGNGTLGRQTVAPYMVHYAGAHTGYGPLLAGPSGFSYLTLRARPDPGPPHYLPAQRALMKDVPRMNVHSEAVEIDAAMGFPEGADDCAVVLDRRADAGTAWLLRLPPDTTRAAPHLPGRGGAFRVVLQGALLAGDGPLGRLACMFVDALDADTPLQAGPDGAQVLVLQFPS